MYEDLEIEFASKAGNFCNANALVESYTVPRYDFSLSTDNMLNPCIDDRLFVYWLSDHQYYSRTIKHTGSVRKHVILYDENDIKAVNLSNEVREDAEEQSLQAFQICFTLILVANKLELIYKTLEYFRNHAFCRH